MQSKRLAVIVFVSIFALFPACFGALPKTSLKSQEDSIRRQRTIFKAKKQANVNLPASVDNSKTKFFPPVIDQQGGSCAQAAGIGYMFTYEINRLLDRDARASADNRFSYLFAWHLLNEGEDQGGFVEQGLMLAKQYGIMTEQDYGKTMQFKWANGYEKYVNAMRYRVDEIYMFEDSVPLMKRYLFDKGDGNEVGGLLTFSGQSRGWTIDSNYDGPSLTGYHSLLTSLATDGSHAMTIVGYDDLVSYTDKKGISHTGAFIVVNSWGESWQDNGRFYLPYDFFRSPEVSSYELSNTVTGTSVYVYEPEVILKANVDYSSRDDLRFAVATSSNIEDAAPASQQFLRIFDRQGGDIPMAGIYSGSQLEFALDITPQIKPDDAKYFLNISRSFGGKKKGTGQLLALSAIDFRGEKPVEYACRDALPRDLADGYNYFGIPLRPRFFTSGSPLRYADDKGTLSTDTYLIRTADGSHAKVNFLSKEPEQHTMTITYETKK